MLEAAGFVVEEEFGTSPGPPGEFPTLSAYLRATAGTAPHAVTATEVEERPTRMRFPEGHYYSPAPDLDELAAEPRRSQIWPAVPREAPGIDWRDGEQVSLFENVFAAQQRLPLAAEPTDDPRDYFTSNDQYPAFDAWLLEAMLQHLRPGRMIEVGSGFSSLVAARANRELLGGSVDITCIEPYPRDFLTAGVPGITRIREEQIQDTPLEAFEELVAGDVLFIDTSHTVKTGGDVPWIFGEILPRLAPGVVVHVHDVFLPGDYPSQWVLEGWGWNEVYLVRAFLAFNAGFQVLAGAQYMLQRHRESVLTAFPEYAAHEHRGGAALWIQRLSA